MNNWYNAYKIYLGIPKRKVTFSLPFNFAPGTGKSLSEALIFASINPKYDDRLFMELPVQYMKTTSAELGQNMRRTCSCHVLCF